MNFDFSQLPAFFVACVIVVITPGVDSFLLLQTSTRSGVRAGMLALAGIHLATVVHVSVVISGAGVVLTRFPVVFTSMRWVGAAYLTYLAFTIIRGLRGTAGDQSVASATGRPFQRAFLSGLTNPKALLFLLALLPQFIGSGRHVPQLTMLSLVFIGTAVVWELMIVLSASRIATTLQRPFITTALDAVCATVFLVISAGLVLSA